MIGFVKGVVKFSSEKKLIVLTNSGLGIELDYAQKLPLEQEVELFVAHVIKENSQQLFGFLSAKEKQLFEIFLQVKGIGPKSAFGLVCQLDLEQVITAVQEEDAQPFKQVPGIGQKAASQILLDLKSKLGGIELKEKAANSVVEDAIQAIESLGLKGEKFSKRANDLYRALKPQSSEQLVQEILRNQQ